MTVMAATAKMLGILLLLVIPGGLPLLCGFFFARALAHARRRALAAAGRSPTLRAVLAELSFREVLREARAAL